MVHGGDLAAAGATVAAMTMYLPNPGLQPTGSEMTEFIDVPPMSEALGGGTGSISRGRRTAARLDTQTRLNITRWAGEYISGLVEDHDGGPDDVRSVIEALHHQQA